MSQCACALASTAAGAYVFLDEASALLYFYVEITYKAAYLGDLAIGKDTYLLVLSHVNHLGSEYASGTVEGGEGLVELSHFSADGGLLFNYVYLKACVCDVKSSLNTCDTAADNECTLSDG